MQDHVREEISICKSISFSADCPICLQDLWSGETFVVPELQEIESSLYCCKLDIRSIVSGNLVHKDAEGQDADDKYSISEQTAAWHAHTSSRDPAGLIVPHIRETFGVELCTNAWAKFYEILVAFRDLTEPIDIRPATSIRSASTPNTPKTSKVPHDSTKGSEGQSNRKLVTLHLCEAPGAFISALNHFLALRRSPASTRGERETAGGRSSSEPDGDDADTDTEYAEESGGNREEVIGSSGSGGSGGSGGSHGRGGGGGGGGGGDGSGCRGSDGGGDGSGGGECGWEWMASSLVSGPRLSGDPIAARVAAAAAAAEEGAAAAAAAEGAAAAAAAECGGGGGGAAHDGMRDFMAGTAARWFFGADGSGPLPRAPTVRAPPPCARPHFARAPRGRNAAGYGG
jgi:hypothetical protein